MHIVCCISEPTGIELKQFIASLSSVTSSEESSKGSSNDESELRTTQKIHKTYEPNIWSHVRIEKVDQVLVEND